MELTKVEELKDQNFTAANEKLKNYWAICRNIQERGQEVHTPELSEGQIARLLATIPAEKRQIDGPAYLRPQQVPNIAMTQPHVQFNFNPSAREFIRHEEIKHEPTSPGSSMQDRKPEIMNNSLPSDEVNRIVKIVVETMQLQNNQTLNTHVN